MFCGFFARYAAGLYQPHDLTTKIRGMWLLSKIFTTPRAEKYEIKTADDKFAVALLALELKQGVLNDMPGRFIESAAFEVNENEFEQYEAAFPFKEKAETDSQMEFRILASLRYWVTFSQNWSPLENLQDVC